MIGSIVGEFKLKHLKTKAVPKIICPTASVGQIILEQPLSKKLKA
ncbi:hypothetical protein [Clostridium neonatale]|nr:hypothetical protein [Clostridium neonatale]CAI3541150.1 hypothetical protein CNEO3_150019 [Clostridium neonatale]CAI3564323.1 hypothetical protein CNEO3_110019 [Clostridium neonatale]CAI3572918.1 hypothetical protein CNEO3_120019 [Clostridium neonatale]CAI3583824.1 hypothetical protein CNEO3_140019 [Clostridium neonatale]CAI3600014.1 hypothetical protein CNEO3_160019 [Clostridium neonatale]